MKPRRFKIPILVFALFVVALVDISQANSGMACRSTHADQSLGFSLQSGDIYLNPLTREIRWRGRVASISKVQYMILENLILADGAPVPVEDFAVDAIRTAQERGANGSDYVYDGKWVSTNMIRLKKFLSENFESSLAERIVLFKNRGYAWTPNKMVAQVQTFDPNKLTYLMDKKRLFKGSNEIILSSSSWFILDRYLNNSFDMISRESWGEIWNQTFHSTPSYHHLATVIVKANHELAEALGTDERVILRDGGYGASGWRLEEKFFDLR